MLDMKVLEYTYHHKYAYDYYFKEITNSERERLLKYSADIIYYYIYVEVFDNEIWMYNYYDEGVTRVIILWENLDYDTKLMQLSDILNLKLYDANKTTREEIERELFLVKEKH